MPPYSIVHTGDGSGLSLLTSHSYIIKGLEKGRSGWASNPIAGVSLAKMPMILQYFSQVRRGLGLGWRVMHRIWVRFRHRVWVRFRHRIRETYRDKVCVT